MDFLSVIENKIFTRNSIQKKVAEWKNGGNKIVFTNGCFDILHIGHTTYLAKARNLGDKLIIALNSDSSVKKLKGEKRPINNENARAIVLASLMFVDAVVVFDEDTPYNLICDILPDILAKGADYKVENIAGSDVVLKNGGTVELIELVDDFSTTKIIEKMTC